MKWYKFDIRDLTAADYEKWYALMSKDKQLRVDRFRFVDDKKRTVAGEMLARKATAEWYDITPESIIFGTQKYGKPYAKGIPVEFNISHSGNMVVCAVDNNPIGIDIEQIRPIDLTIAKRICTDEELLYLFDHMPAEQDFVYTTDQGVLTRFFQLWTAKEASGKCLGSGIVGFTERKMLNQLSHEIDGYIINISRYKEEI